MEGISDVKDSRYYAPAGRSRRVSWTERCCLRTPLYGPFVDFGFVMLSFCRVFEAGTMLYIALIRQHIAFSTFSFLAGGLLFFVGLLLWQTTIYICMRTL